MRFLVDECTGPRVSKWLESEGHDVFCIFRDGRGMDDRSIFRKAQAEQRILITNDKDFGELIFREGMRLGGLVLLRLEDERSSVKIGVLQKLLSNHKDKLPGFFIVATEKTVRCLRGQVIRSPFGMRGEYESLRRTI